MRTSPPRPVTPRPTTSGLYPTVAELVGTPAWRTWLESAVRVVIAPTTTVALLAAAGCTTPSAVPEVAPVIAVPVSAPLVPSAPTRAVVTGPIILSPDKIPAPPSTPPSVPPVLPTSRPIVPSGGGRVITPSPAPPMVQGQMIAVEATQDAAIVE